jgi:hypothetical protein
MKLVVAVGIAALLAGCKSLGTPYPFPTGDDASATLQAQGHDLYLLTLNEKGCYTGKTLLPANAASTPVKVVPNQRLIIEYDNGCVITAAFTPREGAHYWLNAVEGPVESPANETFFQAIVRGKRRQCVVGVTEMDDATQQLTPVRLTKVSPHQKSLACIKLN